MKLLVACSIFLSISIQTAFADEMALFEGLWTINVDKAMENVKNSPNYDASEDEDFKQTLTSMMGMMKLNIQADKVIYSMGKKQEIVSLGKKTASPSSVIAEVDSYGPKAELTFTMVDKKYLNLKSSGSNDMGYIIWEKGAEKANPPKELDVIVDAINDSAAQKK
jgi:hypothetical protein